MFDAAVIGAGPAGAATARLLAQAGWRVALIEKTEFPRRKVCGEFLSATSLPVLEACGIAERYLERAGAPVTRVACYSGDAMIAAPRRHLWGRALNRAVLDTLLRDAAREAGATLFQPADVIAVEAIPGGHALRLESGRIEAHQVIAACGSWNAAGPFALDPPHRADDLFAFKAHFRGHHLPPGLMPLLAFPGGYGGLVESDGGLLSLSCCIRRDALAAARAAHGGKAGEAVLAHITATTRGVAQALEGAAPEGAILASGPIRPGIRPRLERGVFITGNLAGEAHPIIAEGISMAIQSAGLLGALLLKGRGEDYPGAWRRRFGPRIAAAAAFARIAMHAPSRAAARGAIALFPQLLDWGARLSGKL